MFNFKYDNFLYFKEETYIDEELTATFSEHLRKFFLKNNNLFFDIINQEEQACQNLLNFSKDFNKNFSKDIKLSGINTLSKDQLFLVFKNYYNAYLNCSRFLLLNALTGNIVEKELEQILHNKKQASADIHKDRTFIFAFIKETETAKFNKEILKLSINFNTNKLNNILNEFSWLNLEDGFGKPFTDEDIKQMILENKEEAKQKLIYLEEYSEKIKREVAKIMQQYNFNREEQRLYDLMQDIIYYRAKINEDLNKSGYNLLDFFHSFASKFNLTIEELFHLSIDEIKIMIENGIIQKEMINKINIRMNNHAVIMMDGTISILAGNDLNKIEFQSENKNEDNLTILIGRCAHPGKVKSSVVIVNSLSELKKVKKGDILVTKFITPYYIPAMQKASAIITDIGGATSHGAILARELGKPCIIGTEKSTKVLKDNDIIEIDAEKGIIKILNR